MMLIVIGAVIGGMTNAIAIKMLFRPYNPVFIGKWRLPFTPGLIPKRRQELSEQLGKMVMEHLLTAEGIEKKLRNPELNSKLNAGIKALVDDFFKEATSLRHRLMPFVDATSLSSKLDDMTIGYIEKNLEEWIEKNSAATLESLLSEKLQDKVNVILPSAAEYIVANLATYLESEEGKAKLKDQVERFLGGRGMFGNMLQFFLGNQSLIDKLHPEVIKFIQQDEFKHVLLTMIENEWLKLKMKTISELDEVVHFSNIVHSINQTFVLPQLPYKKWLDQPVGKLIGEQNIAYIEALVPKFTQLIIGMIANKTKAILDSLQLEEVVKHEVDNFAVERLEEIVLMISKREFKMITYLGALLGGVIGGVQGIVILIIG